MTGPAGLTIRTITAEADLERLVPIINATNPESPTSLDEIRWSNATYPGTVRFLAEVDGRPVGAATVGRIYVFAPDHPALWAIIGVLPAARRAGIGERLLGDVSAVAGSRGKTQLYLRCAEDRPEAIEFLAHRGFAELERSKTVRLELAGRPVPAVTPPPGIELTTLAARPDLVEGVHAVAIETFPDVPGGDEPMDVGDLEEFRARDVDRPSVPKDAFFVAVDTESGRVVGYACLLMQPGSTTVAYHDMTAVLRAYRGRGIARELKHATIAWAIENGLTALETGNDEANAPMRAVNARLGYEPMPDEVLMRGPLFGGIMNAVTETQTESEPTPSPAEPPTLPPDPVAYDSPRAVRARAKGLQAPYIAGGNDPDPAAGLAEERHYTRLLLVDGDRDRRLGVRHRDRDRPDRAGWGPMTAVAVP